MPPRRRATDPKPSAWEAHRGYLIALAMTIGSALALARIELAQTTASLAALTLRVAALEAKAK